MLIKQINIKYLVKFANGDIGIADNDWSAMIKNNINKCKNIAKSLAKQSSKTLGQQKLNDFFDDFDKIITEY